MADRHPGALVRLALVGALVAVVLAAPAIALGGRSVAPDTAEVTLGAVPVQERCADGSTPPAGGVHDCPTTISLGGLVVPLIAILLGVGAIALIVAFLVLRRQASTPLAPVDPGEWWTCPKCKSTNVVGSARCYACGTWQS